MWESGLEQIDEELLYVGHVVLDGDGRTEWDGHFVHLHQTEHVRHDGRVHRQTCTHNTHRHLKHQQGTTQKSEIISKINID